MIWCIGAGPGDIGYMTQRGRELIAAADVVAGFDAVVEMVRPLVSLRARLITMDYKTQVKQLELMAAAHRTGQKCVVVFMGDLHFSGFQFLERVERACGEHVSIVPGISSAQVLASRTRVCFDETTFITFHRRGDLKPFQRHLIRVLEDGRNAIVIPRPWDFMPHHIANYLIQHRADGSHPVEVWERLTTREAAWKGRLDDCPGTFSDMSIMLIRTLEPMPSQIEPAALVDVANT
jgi:cobalt-precorrin-7 (C5)-methyltransferase